MNNLLTTKQAAARLKIHINTLYRWIKLGIVPAHKIGMQNWYIREADLQALLSGRRAESAHAEPSKVNSRGQSTGSAPCSVSGGKGE
jgi:excisionase family DNA binding protein